MTPYDGNFSENDIKLIYVENYADETEMRVIRRYKTAKGYMALVFVHGTHCLIFVREDYLQFQLVELGKAYTDLGAIEATAGVADSIEANSLDCN